MYKETIEKIEGLLKDTQKIGTDKKQELSSLILELKTELAELPESQKEHAKSIADFTKISLDEAIRNEKDNELMSIAISGLNSSVRHFEASHINLTKITNSITGLLSNLGI
jgi:hypothetical protein